MHALPSKDFQSIQPTRNLVHASRSDFLIFEPSDNRLPGSISAIRSAKIDTISQSDSSITLPTAASETCLAYTAISIYAMNTIFSNPTFCILKSTDSASQKGAQLTSSLPPQSNTKNGFKALSLTAKYTTQLADLGLELFHPINIEGKSSVRQGCNGHFNPCPNRISLQDEGQVLEKSGVLI